MGRVPVHELTLQHDGAPVVGEAAGVEVRTLQHRYVDGERIVVTREPQQQVTLDRAVEVLVEAAHLLDRRAPDQHGGEVDGASGQQLAAITTHRSGTGEHGRCA